MGMDVLLADHREYPRKALRRLFSTIPIVESIYEAATIQELKRYLVSSTVDLVMIHQSLIEDINVLPGIIS